MIDAHSRSTRLNRLNATTVLTVVFIVRTITTATPNIRARRFRFFDHVLGVLDADPAFVEISCRRNITHKTNDNMGHGTKNVKPARSSSTTLTRNIKAKQARKKPRAVLLRMRINFILISVLGSSPDYEGESGMAGHLTLIFSTRMKHSARDSSYRRAGKDRAESEIVVAKSPFHSEHLNDRKGLLTEVTALPIRRDERKAAQTAGGLVFHAISRFLFSPDAGSHCNQSAEVVWQA
jgi:hypothetical protein